MLLVGWRWALLWSLTTWALSRSGWTTIGVARCLRILAVAFVTGVLSGRWWCLATVAVRAWLSTWAPALLISSVGCRRVPRSYLRAEHKYEEPNRSSNIYEVAEDRYDAHRGAKAKQPERGEKTEQTAQPAEDGKDNSQDASPIFATQQWDEHQYVEPGCEDHTDNSGKDGSTGNKAGVNTRRPEFR